MDLNDAVRRDCFGAGVKDILLDLRHSQREAPEGRIQTRQVAINFGQKWDLAFCDASKLLRSVGKGRFGLSGICLACVGHRGQKHTAVCHHRPQIVKLRGRFRRGKEIWLEVTEDNFLQHVLKEINLIVALDQSADGGPKLMELGG